MKRTATFWKQTLQLTPHVEGGAFSEVYRSDLLLPKEILQTAHKGNRNAATSIYFLLERGEISAFHRIASDELWHFYDGDPLTIFELREGKLITHRLGLDPETGALPQVLIPAGSWFGSRVEGEGAFTLCGCTVSPGFDFADFELADRQILLGEYPEYEELIQQLTR